MSTATLTAPVTVRSLLLGDRPGTDTADGLGRLLSDHGTAREALRDVRNLPAAAVHSVEHEVGSVLDGLLDLSLADIVVSCWRKHRSLTEAAGRTLAAPGTEEVVALATHRMTVSYSPHVDLFVDEVKVATFRFELVVVLEATGLSAVVTRGDLVAVQGGDWVATATLSLEGARLAERRSRVAPAVMLPLPHPLPLTDRPAAPAAT